MSFLEKVSKINNDPSIYGTFAEIGAGQEVAHAFFQVGRASSTIAKTMSAYDMKFSDAIYGEGKSYVCERRLQKMLTHEYELIVSRLKNRAEFTRFFVFADTVATGSQRKKIPGHGWLGVTFQHKPGAKISQVCLHVNFKPHSPLQQHRAVGEMGVNILYGCFHHYNNIHDFLSSVTEDFDLDSMEMDYIKFSGEVFSHIDQRSVAIELVKRGLTRSVIFNEQGLPKPPSVLLYKKHIAATQGSFLPLTSSKWKLMSSGAKNHQTKHGLTDDEILQLAGISVQSLYHQGEFDLDALYFRIDMLSQMNICVMVSDFSSDFSLIQRLNHYSTFSKALVVGSHSLTKVLDESHYQHLTGGLLEALGMMVSQNTTLYIYPVKFPGRDLLGSESVFLCQNKRMLLDYLKATGLCYELPRELADSDVLDYYSSELVRELVYAGQSWHKYVPKKIIPLIEQNKALLHKQMVSK
ncbi:MAG: hypothetical protein OXC40_07090 [Proteobacteria bacterium]|nr:hypothetical protein [Pseudomonadota bacterium]